MIPCHFYVINVTTKPIHKLICQNMSKSCMKGKKISNVKIVNLKPYMKVSMLTVNEYFVVICVLRSLLN